jgi:hypothetical protein
MKKVGWGDLNWFVCLVFRHLHALGYLKSFTGFFAITFGLTSPSTWCEGETVLYQLCPERIICWQQHQRNSWGLKQQIAVKRNPAVKCLLSPTHKWQLVDFARFVKKKNLKEITVISSFLDQNVLMQPAIWHRLQKSAIKKKLELTHHFAWVVIFFWILWYELEIISKKHLRCPKSQRVQFIWYVETKIVYSAPSEIFPTYFF